MAALKPHRNHSVRTESHRTMEHTSTGDGWRGGGAGKTGSKWPRLCGSQKLGVAYVHRSRRWRRDSFPHTPTHPTSVLLQNKPRRNLDTTAHARRRRRRRRRRRPGAQARTRVRRKPQARATDEFDAGRRRR